MMSVALKSENLQNIVIEPLTSYKKLEIYSHLWNKDKKAADRLKGGHYQLAKLLISLYCKQIRQMSKTININPDSLPTFTSNNMQLASILKCTDRTILNYINKLLKMKVILRKIQHGRHHDYELIINPKVLQIGQVLDENSLNKQIKKLRSEFTAPMKERSRSYPLNSSEKKNFLPSAESNRNYLNTPNSGVDKGKAIPLAGTLKSQVANDLNKNKRTGTKKSESKLRQEKTQNSANFFNSLKASYLQQEQDVAAAAGQYMSIVENYASMLADMAIILLWRHLGITVFQRREIIDQLVINYFLDSYETHKMTSYGIKNLFEWFQFYEKALIKHAIYFDKEAYRGAPLPHIYFNPKDTFSQNEKRLPKFLDACSFIKTTMMQQVKYEKEKKARKAEQRYFKNSVLPLHHPEKIPESAMLLRTKNYLEKLEDNSVFDESMKRIIALKPKLTIEMKEKLRLATLTIAKNTND